MKEIVQHTWLPEGCYQFQGQENFVFVKCGFVDQTFSLVASLICYDISGNLRRVVHGSIKLLLPPKMSLVGRLYENLDRTTDAVKAVGQLQ